MAPKDSLGTGHLPWMQPGYQEPPRSDAEREAVIAARVARYEEGLDIFTGEPLRGLDQENWLLLQMEQQEYEGSFLQLELV
jgi:hypothetical protein